MPSSTASRWRRRSRTSWPRWASSSARSPRRCASIRSWCASTSARWCRTTTTSSPPSTRRSSATARSATSPRACAARWSCPPISASTRPGTGQFERTLIVAEEGAYVSYLEGCTAPHARREPVARGGRGTGRRRRRLADQVFDGAELVSRRQGGQGRHLQLRDQARRLPRRRLEDLAGRRWRPARPSPGSIPA